MKTSTAGDLQAFIYTAKQSFDGSFFSFKALKCKTLFLRSLPGGTRGLFPLPPVRVCCLPGEVEERDPGGERFSGNLDSTNIPQTRH